jgi:hypothetical protein
MRTPPNQLDGATVLMYRVGLTRNAATGATRHLAGANTIEGIECLAIAQYTDESGFYLFYCDREWQVLADTLHDTRAAAQAQAQLEFGEAGSPWVNMGDTSAPSPASGTIDWRLTNQAAYLTGITLAWRQYKAHSATWEHEHCAFCWAKFMAPGKGGELTVGYCTPEEEHWICESCFNDFHPLFKWQVAAP